MGDLNTLELRISFAVFHFQPFSSQSVNLRQNLSFYLDSFNYSPEAPKYCPNFTFWIVWVHFLFFILLIILPCNDIKMGIFFFLKLQGEGGIGC